MRVTSSQRQSSATGRPPGRCNIPTNGSDIFKYFENYEKEGNGLGNTESGDGTRYRGAGAIQITGRAVYEALGTAMGNEKITSDGALYVAQNYFWESAGFYWKVYKPGTASDDRYDLNKKCDESETVDEDEIVKEITRIIRGACREKQSLEYSFCYGVFMSKCLYCSEKG